MENVVRKVNEGESLFLFVFAFRLISDVYRKIREIGPIFVNEGNENNEIGH